MCLEWSVEGEEEKRKTKTEMGGLCEEIWRKCV